MADAWALVLLLIVTTAIIRASGPVVLGGRELPPRLLGVVALLAPALLAALVMTETFRGEGTELTLDARALIGKAPGSTGGSLRPRSSLGKRLVAPSA